MKLLVVLLGVAFCLAACGDDKPSGSIIELSYIPAHRANVEVEDYVTICIPIGSVMDCYEQPSGSHYEEQAFDAQWNAVLMRCTPDFKCGERLMAISREEYSSWTIGDYYPTVLKYPTERAG
jgi:hypothetical protein